jgi:hypothetical protein
VLAEPLFQMRPEQISVPTFVEIAQRVADFAESRK